MTFIRFIYVIFLSRILQLSDLEQCHEAIRYFAQSNRIFRAVLSKWPTIKEIIRTLEIPNAATLAVQRSNFVLTDFYGCWLKIQINLKKRVQDENSSIDLAQRLLDSMDKRKKDLLEHPGFICGMYLDPRFHCELTTAEKRISKETLIQFWQRVYLLNGNETIKEPVVDELEEYFSSKNQPTVSGVVRDFSGKANMNLSNEEFGSMLKEYETNLPRLHHSTSILDYWAGRTSSSSHVKELIEIKMVAFIVLGTPSTQVPCERSFSHLNFIYNDRRSLLEQERLENILLIRTNAELFDEVKAEDLDRIK